MDRKGHWENVYSTKSHKEVSWFTEHIQSSLGLISKANVPKSSAIIDIGGGASTLCDDLLNDGYSNLTVIDISGSAIKIAQDRLAAESNNVNWIEDDILESDYNGRVFDLWHDRAVFHFLTVDQDRNIYKNKLLKHLNIGGTAIFSVFADDGPLKCSMLEVKRHSESDLVGFFKPEFEQVFSERVVHKTPSGNEQRFVNVILKRIN